MEQPKKFTPCTLAEFLRLRSTLYPTEQMGTECWEHLMSSLHGALERLSVDLYTLESHFLLELIQNAEDNTYEEGVIPEVIFEVCDDFLLMRNNEQGWSLNNIRGICGVNKSTKKDLAGFIGQKGIGFKSVFKVSQTPHIFWRELAFFFDELQHPEEGIPLGFIYPHTNGIDERGKKEVQKDERFENWTNIYLPFKDPSFGHKIRDEILNENNPYQYLLLFLKKLKKITFLLPDRAPIVYEMQQEGHFVTLGGTKYLVARSPVEMTGIKEAARNFSGYQPELLLALPLDLRKQQELQTKGKLYAFLPTEMKPGFPFLINSDFVVAASRERADLKSPWNSRLLHGVAPLFCRAFLYLLQIYKDDLLQRNQDALKNEKSYHRWLYELLSNSKVSPEFEFISRHITSTLATEKIIPTHALSFETPRVCYQANDSDRKLLWRDFCNNNIPYGVANVFIVPSWLQDKSWLVALFRLEDTWQFWRTILQDTAWIHGHYDDDDWFAEFLNAHHSSARLKSLIPLEGTPHFATSATRIYLHKAKNFRTQELPVLAHLRVVKESLFGKLMNGCLQSEGVKNSLDSVSYAKELASHIKTSGRYPEGFNRQDQRTDEMLKWILQTFANNRYWPVPTEHQFPILIDGKLVDWVQVLPLCTANALLGLMTSGKESAEWINCENSIRSTTLPGGLLGSDQAEQLFPHKPPLPFSQSNRNELAALSWMQQECFAPPDNLTRQIQRVLLLLTWMKEKESKLTLPCLPFIPTTIGLAPPGLVLYGATHEALANQIPVLDKGLRDYSRYTHLNANNLASVESISDFLQRLKSAMPRPNEKTRNIAQYCYAMLQNLRGYRCSLPKSVPIPYLSECWIDSSSEQAFFIPDCVIDPAVLERVDIYNVQACAFTHEGAISFLRNNVQSTIPIQKLLCLIRLLKEDSQRKEKGVEEEHNKQATQHPDLLDRLCFLYGQLNDLADLVGLEKEAFIFFRNSWWKPGQLRALPKHELQHAQKVKLLDIIEIQNVIEEPRYTSEKIRKLFRRLNIPTHLTLSDYLEVLEKVPTCTFGATEFEEVITEAYRQLVNSNRKSIRSIPSPSSIYSDGGEFVSDFQAVFLPSKVFSDVEAPMAFLPIHVDSAELCLMRQMLNTWGVRTLDEVIKGQPTTTPIEVANHDEVKEKLEKAFPHFLLAVLTRLFDSTEGPRVKCKLNVDDHAALLHHLQELVSVEPSPLKKVMAIEQKFDTTDPRVSLKPVSQKVWWDIKGKSIYFVIDDKDEQWDGLADRILDTIFLAFRPIHHEAVHNFILLCKEICTDVEQALKRWDRKASDSGIIVGTANIARPGELVTLLTQNLAQLSILSKQDPSPSFSSTLPASSITFNPKDMVEDESFVGAIDATMAGIGSICIHTSDLTFRKQDGAQLELHQVGKEKEKEKEKEGEVFQHARVIQLSGIEPFSPSKKSPPASPVRIPGGNVMLSSSPTRQGGTFKRDLGRWGEQYTFSRVLPALIPHLLQSPTLDTPTFLNNNTIVMSDQQHQVKIIWENETSESYHPFDLRVLVSDGKQEQIFFVEVKTTPGNKRQFFLSRNECDFALAQFGRYMIVRVNNAAATSPDVSIFLNPILSWNIHLSSVLKVNTVVLEY